MIGGLESCVKICKQSTVQRVVAAVSQVVVCLVPCPKDIVRWHDDEFSIPVEKVNALGT